MVARLLPTEPAVARVDALISVQAADAADENRVPVAHWALPSVDLKRSEKRTRCGCLLSLRPAS